MREGAAAGLLAFGTTALCLVIGAFSVAIAARGAAFGTANRGVAHRGTTATASISTK